MNNLRVPSSNHQSYSSFTEWSSRSLLTKLPSAKSHTVTYLTPPLYQKSSLLFPTCINKSSSYAQSNDSSTNYQMIDRGSRGFVGIQLAKLCCVGCHLPLIPDLSPCNTYSDIGLGDLQSKIKIRYDDG